MAEKASGSKWGHVKVGTNISVTEDGVISIPNASPSIMGVMRAGDGLTVLNGVVSGNVFIDDKKSLDDPPTVYLLGETITVPNISPNNLEYRKYTTIMNNTLGLSMDVTLRFSFQYILRTLKTNNGTSQKIEVYYNVTNSLSKAFELTRIGRISSWEAWRINALEIIGEKSPEGSVNAYKGTLYRDYETGVLYHKTTGTDGASNTGWVSLDSKLSKHQAYMVKHNQIMDGGIKKQLVFGINPTLNCLTIDITEATE